MNKIKIIKKRPDVIFIGSTIQQNHGESLNNHGYMIWNINDKSHELIEIQNDYGYVTLEINEGKIVDDTQRMPKKPRIRLKVVNTTGSELKDCLIDLRQKYKPDEVTINRTVTSIDKKVEAELDLTNIRDVEFQNTLIRDYVQRNFNVTDEILDEICDINKELNKKLPVEEVIRNVMWKPKTFKWSNMFSYGEDNIIDFTKLKGITGLFNANTSGKSSLLESLAFALFDKCAKSFKAKDVMNSQKDTFKCQLNFEIDGVDYFIEKSATRGKNDKVSVKINYYTIDENGEKQELNGDARRDTSAVIRSYVGDYEDFNLTALSSQNNKTNFIELGQSDRKDLLSQFMDISIFDKLSELGTLEIKEYATLSKEFEKRDFDEELSEIENWMVKLSTEYKSLILNKESIISLKNTESDSLLELAKKLIQIDSDVKDVDLLESSKKDLISKIKTSIKNTESLENNIKEYKTLMEKLNDSIKHINLKDVEKQHGELLDLETKHQMLTSKLDKLKIEVKHKLDKTQKLLELEYDANCKYCMNNIFVKDAILAKNDLENDKQKSLKLLEEKKKLDESITEKSGIREIRDSYIKTKKEYDLVNMKFLSKSAEKSSEESKLESFKNKLDKIETDINLYYTSKESIESNKLVEIEMLNVKNKISAFDSKLIIVEKSVVDISSRIMILKNKKESITNDIKSFQQLENKYTAFQRYLDAIKRDGIAYELISKSVPQIESEINNILSQMVPFSVLLDLDGKNVNVKIVYDENRFWPIELASGMEKFVSGLAIRVALINISNLPRPNFLALDEGFSSLDADNISNLSGIFDYLKTQFDFVLVISHIDSIRDFVDMSLDLIKQDDFSKIVLQ